MSDPGNRTTYDPGPSGTAVTALIIALIALAVALYAVAQHVPVMPVS